MGEHQRGDEPKTKRNASFLGGTLGTSLPWVVCFLSFFLSSENRVYFKALSLRTRTPGARALLPATRCQSSGPLGALLSSPALDVRLITALQVLQVQGSLLTKAACSVCSVPSYGRVHVGLGASQVVVWHNVCARCGCPCGRPAVAIGLCDCPWQVLCAGVRN